MRALVVDRAPAPASKRLGRQRTPAANLPRVEYRDIKTPEPHARGWVLVRPALAGICGQDVALVRGDQPPSVLSAYAERSPVIPGHEVIGIVERTAQTRWVREGHRVLVEPTLRCAHKGLPDCARCRVGETHLCENADRAGALCSGRALGASEHTGGGWSEGFLVHEDMLVPADGIPDQRGVLAEPSATALHAVTRWTRRGERAIVIGSGTLTRLIVATLCRMYPDLDVTLVHDILGATRVRRGRRLLSPATPRAPETVPRKVPGAARVWRGSSDELLSRTAELVGARLMRPTGGGAPVLDRGVDVVFDCRGSAQSLDLALRLLRAGGTLVLGGHSGRHEVEWPLVWGRELTVCGSALYGREPGGHRTYAVVREWLTDPFFPIDNMVTHRFPLDEFDTALQTAAAGTSVGAVKVVFEGPIGSLRRLPHEGDEGAQPESPVLLQSTAARVRAEH